MLLIHDAECYIRCSQIIFIFTSLERPPTFGDRHDVQFQIKVVHHYTGWTRVVTNSRLMNAGWFVKSLWFDSTAEGMMRHTMGLIRHSVESTPYVQLTDHPHLLFSLLSRMREQGVQFTSRLWPCNSLSWLKAMGTATAQHIWCVHTTSGWCMYVNFSELLRE